MARIDRSVLLYIADCLAVAVAVALPWSTSATQIFGVAWLLLVLPAIGWKPIKQELASAPGGLPLLLWCAALVGTLWADVGWRERLEGLDSFHRLLVIPVLLTEFRQSERGFWVLYGFLISAAALLIVSFVLLLTPGLSWRGTHPGIPVHDDIFQGSVSLICAFALFGVAVTALREGCWCLASVLVAAAALFLGNFAVVSLISRSAVPIAFALACLLGWRSFRWAGILVSVAIMLALGVAFWFGSLTVRERAASSMDELTNYRVFNRATSIGEHIAFLEESVAIITSAPIIGHGTGSIADQFRRITAGKSGVSGEATDNPHNQTFTIAIQLGIVGVILLWSMWIAHFLLFNRDGTIAWMGTVVVVENVLSSAVHSHLFDFANGWLYIFGVGVLGGMILRQRDCDRAKASAAAEPAVLHNPVET